MVPLRVSGKSFDRRYRQRTRALQELARDLHDRPPADEVHDLRVTARRIQVMRRLLPRKVRQSGSGEFDLALKSALKATSQLRDLDTLIETLEPYEASLPSELMVTLVNQRSDAAAQSMAATDELAVVPPPELDQSEVRGKKLTRRLKKRVRKHDRIVADLLSKVLEDESKVAELHALRKEVKKLRYLLELADEIPLEVPTLTSSQESLGAIHDLDVAMSYIQGSHIDFKGRAVGELRRSRHSKYLKFVGSLRDSAAGETHGPASTSATFPEL
ncbi:MAG: CHAD domain-containing protein [Thaumarchaeota archaeon]|nr:CHAD domain-containing protein [Nitrososphaerota archaeon]